MSTKGLLEEVVVEAGRDVGEQLGLIQEFVEAARSTPAGKRTEDERQILRVQAAANRKKNFLPLVNVTKAISAGGVDQKGMPLLAVATYDMSFGKRAVNANVEANGAVTFRDSASGWNNPWEIVFPAGTLPRASWPKNRDHPLYKSAAVPIIPPALRQANPKNMIVLFEVAKWEPAVRVDVDPYLLKLVAGTIYAVVGTWDVTKLELKAFQVARHFGVQ